MKNHSKFFLALLLIMLLLISVFVFLLENASAATAAPLDALRNEIRQHFSKVEGRLVETRISGWVKVQHSGIQLPVLLEKARDLLSLLGQDVQAQIHSEETANYRRVKVSAQTDGVEYIIHLYNSATDESENHTYVIAEAYTDSGSIDCESAAYAKVEEMLSKYDKSPLIGTTYSAAVPGKLKGKRMEQIARQLFDSLDADIVELSRDTDWISLTGYSNRIGGGLDSINGRFNLNIALRYHSYEDKTYICLGTPVISIPY